MFVPFMLAKTSQWCTVALDLCEVRLQKAVLPQDPKKKSTSAHCPPAPCLFWACAKFRHVLQGIWACMSLQRYGYRTEIPEATWALDLNHQGCSSDFKTSMNLTED